MTVLRVDHTAVAVRDLGTAITRFQSLLGVTASDREYVPEQGVEIAFLDTGGTKIELIQPTDATSGVSRFLDRHGEGLHHIALLVDDISGELSRLEGEEVELIDHKPRSVPGELIAFVHPKGTGGTLIELIQAVSSTG